MKSSESISTADDIDLCIDNFSSCILNAAENSIPSKKPFKYRFPYSDEIKTLIKYRNYHRNQFRKYQWFHDKSAMSQLNRLIRLKISQLNQEKFQEKIASLLVKDNSIWQMTKALKNKTIIVPPLTTKDTLAYTDIEKSNILAKNFKTAHLLTTKISSPHDLLVKKSIEKIKKETILKRSSACYHSNPNYVEKLIKSTKPNKAPGEDRISNLLLKRLPKISHKILSTIFNSCLDLSYFPSKWKKAKITAILKPGKRSDEPSSYRPISLLSSVGKLFEKLILECLNDHEENNKEHEENS